MTADTGTTKAADAAAAPLDLLLTDAATGMLRRVNPGGSGLRLAAALNLSAVKAAVETGRLAPICDALGTYVYDR